MTFATLDEIGQARSWIVLNGEICCVNALHPPARPGMRWRDWKSGFWCGSRWNGLHDNRGQASSCCEGFRGGGHGDRDGWVLGGGLAAAWRQTWQRKPGTPRPDPTSSHTPPSREQNSTLQPHLHARLSRRSEENLGLDPGFLSWVLKLLEEDRTSRPRKWVWRSTSPHRPDSGSHATSCVPNNSASS